MDFSPALALALQRDLDVTRAYPEAFHISPRVLDKFVDSLIKKLHTKLLALLEEGGERFVMEKNPEGMALFFATRGVRLPGDMLLKMSKTIVETARYHVEWISPRPNSDGDLWYIRMIVDLEPEIVL